MATKTDKPEMLFREACLDVSGMKEGSRECELSFASESPVTRMDWEDGESYQEVLSCNPADVDLARLNNGHPLLLNHDTRQQIGVVKSARVDGDKKARAVVKFSRSALGNEILQDVQDGIRTLVSVGYRVGNCVKCEQRDGMEFRTFAWTPHEVSIVPIPADNTVGVGRAEVQPTEAAPAVAEAKVEPKPQIKTMSDPTTPAPVVDVAQIRAAERARATEIRAIASRLAARCPKISEKAEDAINSGTSIEAFREVALNELPALQPVSAKAPLADVKAKDWANYSISRAVTMSLEGKLDGFEKEMSDEVALKTGKRSSGVWVPDEAFTRNAIAGTGTLGGMLVPTINDGSEFVTLLRNKSQVVNMGARVINLTQPTVISRQNGAHTANWAGETVASTLSGINLTQFTLTPQAVTSYVQYSKQLLMENNVSIDALLRDDITEQLALAIDLAALHGTGSGQPTGIIGTTGIGSVLLSTNGLSLANATAYPALVSLESVLAAANADQGSLGYLMRPAIRGQLKTQSRFASTNTPVFENEMVNGYKALTTNQISKALTEGTATTITTPVFFGNWSDLLIANFGATDLVVDPYTAGANGVVRLYARRWSDIGVRRPASFAILGGVLNG